MPIERIHPRKLLITSIARKRLIIRTQLFVPLTTVLACKTFTAPWQMTLAWFPFCERMWPAVMSGLFWGCCQLQRKQKQQKLNQPFK